jgi:hypothetical protein
MALVECRECGSDVSDSAATCPHCGVSAPAGEVSLVFIRAGTYGRANRIELFIDQEPLGKIVGGVGLEVLVTPGSHHIELRSNRKSTVGTIDASDDMEFKVTMSAMGSPKLG